MYVWGMIPFSRGQEGFVSGLSSGDDNFPTPSPKEVFALTDNTKLQYGTLREGY